MRRLGLATLAVLFSAGSADAAEWATGASLELGPGVDSNALRESTAGDVVADGFIGGLLRARAATTGERAQFSASLSEGVKLFFGQGAASLSVTRVDARGRMAIGDRLVAGADLSLKDLTERGHVRDEDSLRSAVVLELPTDVARFSIQGGFALSVPRGGIAPAQTGEQLTPGEPLTLRDFMSDGPIASGQIAWSLSPKNTLLTGYELWKHYYPRWSTPRDDLTQTASAEYTWHGPFIAAAGYAFSWNTSSVSGGAYTRHRVTARGAAFLPFDLSLAAQASLQRSFYPNGIFVEEELLLEESDENQNTLEVRIARPISEGVEVALKLAHYGNELSGGSTNAIPFRREVALFAVSWRTGD